MTAADDANKRPMDSQSQAIRQFWDDDAETYDRSTNHHPDAAERAAWRGCLDRLLPTAPVRILDVGAGTGFLSLLAVELGHDVTALDMSEQMLGQLTAKASMQGLEVHCVTGRADEPPPGPFDVVVERHVLWTLPDPSAALSAWRTVCPSGRLVAIESLWGSAGHPVDRIRSRSKELLRWLRRTPPDHHGDYAAELRRSLPLGDGTPVQAIADLVQRTGWGPARVSRLTDVEWAATLGRPTVDRLLGVTPRFAVSAGS